MRAMETERRVVRQLAGHLMMGGVFGASFAAYLLWSNTCHLREVIAGSEAPVVVTAAFVIGLAVNFAFTAAVTAFLFICEEG
jgi:hypothetical protein